VVLNLELLTFGPIGPLIRTLDQTLWLGTRLKLQTLLNSNAVQEGLGGAEASFRL
jgi:2-keto-4-pentenoate hydratase/2-oxohepta-3-ene-1,7-dioic acid hydratase in catechol pathway